MRWFLLGQRTIRLFFRNVKHRKKKESIYLCPMCLRIARPKTKAASGCRYRKPNQLILVS
ncbi:MULTISPECIES: hypothetical protein [Xanthomonas]|uniref:Uncharacterized protein n=1 Tax=Xanthomonas sontii TaxID=2650745 RepID=A0A6N7QH01_9XANT|nr:MULTISPECIES: hypothetical protein [Xanthomonas]MRH02447.1 hypothetical protein [Xanthomonas sontii]MRH76778.1 hypothetical protein [Xanthomonas sontii]